MNIPMNTFFDIEQKKACDALATVRPLPILPTLFNTINALLPSTATVSTRKCQTFDSRCWTISLDHRIAIFIPQSSPAQIPLSTSLPP
jgi:hypothetical protein